MKGPYACITSKYYVVKHERDNVSLLWRELQVPNLSSNLAKETDTLSSVRLRFCCTKPLWNITIQNFVNESRQLLDFQRWITL